MSGGEYVLVAAFALGVALLLVAMFTTSMTLLITGGLLVAALFVAGPVLELRRQR